DDNEPEPFLTCFGLDRDDPVTGRGSTHAIAGTSWTVPSRTAQMFPDVAVSVSVTWVPVTVTVVIADPAFAVSVSVAWVPVTVVPVLRSDPDQLSTRPSM